MRQFLQYVFFLQLLTYQSDRITTLKADTLKAFRVGDFFAPAIPAGVPLPTPFSPEPHTPLTAPYRVAVVCQRSA